MASCLRAHGWEATVYPELDGLSVANATAANRHELPAALEKCQSEIGVLPPPEPLTEAEIRERYRFLVEARDCLIALGYEISEPPSEDAFVASWPEEAEAIIRSGP